MLNRVWNFFRNAEQVRSLDAAAGGRRWEGAKTVPNRNAAIFAGGRTTAHRASYQALNNPHVANFVSALVSNLVGTGLTPQSEHPNQAQRQRIEQLWASWSDHADAAGLGDFSGVQELMARAMCEKGESFARLRPRLPADGLPVPLQLEVMDPDQVPIDLHRDMANDARVRGGVEFDALGRRVAFHVYRQRPGDGPLALETARVPAADMVHLFKPLGPGQVRGLSWLAPVLLGLHELDQFQDAQLVKQKVQAMLAGFIVDPEGDAAGFDKAKSGGIEGILEAGLEPGTLYNLPGGRDIRFSEPPAGGAEYAAYVKASLRAIAAGLGITYEQLTGDLEGVNYSSIRAGLIEFRRRIAQLQRNVLVFQLCRPVWDRFVRLAILSGALEAPDFAAHPERYRAKWVSPGWDWVDPQKDLQAEILAIDAGIKSRQQVIAERGRDPEQVDAEIAADAMRKARAGASPAPNGEPRSPANDDAQSETDGENPENADDN